MKTLENGASEVEEAAHSEEIDNDEALNEEDVNGEAVYSNETGMLSKIELINYSIFIMVFHI
jgi:hypothetical protein